MSQDTGEVRIAHPGTRCSPIGATAVSKLGTALICRINPDKPPADGFAHWGAADPKPRPTRRRGNHRTRQGLERRYVDQWAAEQPAAEAPLPDKLLEQLNDVQLCALRAAGGLPAMLKPRRSDLDKLDRAGLLQDGQLTSRGVDALRRAGELDEQWCDADRRAAFDARYPAPAVAPAPVNRPAATAADTGSTDGPDEGTDPVAGWEEFDQCTTCPAKPSRPCRDLRRARGGHVGRTTPTTDHPHRGRPKLATALPRPAAPEQPAPAAPRRAACGNCRAYLDAASVQESTVLPGICVDCATQMGRPEPKPIIVMEKSPVQAHITTIEGPDSAGHFGWNCICGEDSSGLEALDVVEDAMDHGPLAADSPLPNACTGCGDLLPAGNSTGICPECADDAAENVRLGKQGEALLAEKEAELAAQAAYAQFLTNPDDTTGEELAAALGASTMSADDRRNIERLVARRIRNHAERPTEIRNDLAPAARAMEAEAAYKRATGQHITDISDDDLAAALHHPASGRTHDALVTEATRRMFQPDPSVAPVPRMYSAAPVVHNTWGNPNGPGPGDVHYHDHGVAGQASRALGGDGTIEVDGEPAVNHVHRIAGDVDNCNITPQEGADRMMRLRDRLPAGSRGRAALDRAVAEMACPPMPLPDLPAETPEPVRRLIADLHEIPMVRRDSPSVPADDNRGHEVGRLIDVVNRWQSGDRNAAGMRFITSIISAAYGRRHESNGDRGKRAIDRRVQQAVAELKTMRQADRTVFYPPTEK